MDKNQPEMNTHDRLMRAWENSMEMVRDFEMYSKRVEEDDIREMFKEFAEDEGIHASKLREALNEYTRNNKHNNEI